MTSSHLNRACAVAAACLGLACLPAAARAVEIPECAVPPQEPCVSEFEGTVTDIGVQRGVDQVGGIEYRIDGTFKYAGAFDLSKSKITFHNLFDEVDWGTDENGNVRKGNGEMVLTTNNADLVCPDDPLRPGGCTPALAPLLSAKSSKKTEAKYETDSRFRPPMRVQIENNGGEWEFDVRLDRGTSPQVTPPQLLAKLPPGKGQFPKLCSPDPDPRQKRPITKIRIRFTIEQQDGKADPVTLDFVTVWECDPPGRYHLRSR